MIYRVRPFDLGGSEPQDLLASYAPGLTLNKNYSVAVVR